MTKKLEKFSDFSKGDNDFNLSSSNKLLKIPSEIVDIREKIANNSEEINYLHKSVANLRSDVRTIFREELKAALNGGVQR
jgi:hypothetical protein